MSIKPIEKLEILNSKIVYKDGTVITMIPDVLQKINELIEVVNEQSERIRAIIHILKYQEDKKMLSDNNINELLKEIYDL